MGYNDGDHHPLTLLADDDDDSSISNAGRLLFESSRYLPVLATNLSAIGDIARKLTNSTREDDYDEDDEEWNPDGLSDGQILKQTLTLYGTFFLVCL